MNLKKIITAAIFAGVAVASGPASAELAGNIGFTSNYVWRGLSQTSDQAAISGGVDFTHKDGFYIGTWFSNVDFDGNASQYEHDVYGGYGFKAGPVDLDVGYIQYLYPVGDNTATYPEFSEAYVNATYKQFGGGLALTLSKDGTGDDNDLYIYATVDFELKKALNLNLLIGNYDFDAAGSADYTHYHASLSKGDFTLAFDKTDLSGSSGDPRFSISWTKGFDL